MHTCRSSRASPPEAELPRGRANAQGGRVMKAENQQTRGGTDPAEVKRWVDAARNLPDARLEKVESAKRAIAEHVYDNDELIEALLAPVAAEVGGLDD